MSESSVFLVSLHFVEMAEETDVTTPRPKRPREDNAEQIANPAVFIMIDADRLHRCMENLIGYPGSTITLIPPLQRGKQFIVILEKYNVYLRG